MPMHTVSLRSPGGLITKRECNTENLEAIQAELKKEREHWIDSDQFIGVPLEITTEDWRR